MNNIIRNLQKRSIKQHTKEWFERRKLMVTASDCGSILDYDSYRDNVLYNKLNDKGNISNVYTEHGTYYEPIAREIFENKTKLKVFPCGLIIHKNFPYIGASPDGITSNSRLLEIKCPVTRNISGYISLKYYAQVQLQLEVAELEYCYFYECDFKEYETKSECNSIEYSGYNRKKKKYWNLEFDNLMVIQRNENWFLNNIPKFKNFYEKLIDLKSRKRYSLRKRKREEDLGLSQSIKRRSHRDINYKWLSEKNIRNYILNDCLSDWLDLYGEDHGYEVNSTPFLGLLWSRSNNFKNEVLWDIEKKFPNIVRRVPYFYKYSIDLEKITINYMKKGEKIIAKGLIANSETLEYSIPDLLIRSDFLCRIFPHLCLNNLKFDKKSRFGKWSYVIFNIKFMKLHFTSNSLYLLNTKNFVLLKSQTAFQVNLLNVVQNTKNKAGIVIGNGWTFKSSDVVNVGTNPFQKLGIVYLNNYDEKYIGIYKSAVGWYRELEEKGSKWKVLPVPSKKELYPLISSANLNKWSDVKNEIAIKLKELTLLWNVGKKARDIAHELGIYKWDDPKLIEYLPEIGFSPNGNKNLILRKILDVNKKNVKKVISPNRILNNDDEWKCKNYLEYFVDFETVDKLVNDKPMIYLIGLLIHNPNGVTIEDKFQFFSYCADTLILSEEHRIIEKWIQKMENTTKQLNVGYEPNIYCWSSAEEVLLNKAKMRHNKDDERWDVHFTDFMKVFKSEPITLKGCLSGFSLKKISEVFYKNNFITSIYDTDCTNGGLSMLTALNYYSKKDINAINDLKKYNYLDCYTIWEIMDYLRRNNV